MAEVEIALFELLTPLFRLLLSLQVITVFLSVVRSVGCGVSGSVSSVVDPRFGHSFHALCGFGSVAFIVSALVSEGDLVEFVCGFVGRAFVAEGEVGFP